METHSIPYSKAINELETILKEIENKEIDVDELASKIKRAAELNSICTTKLKNAEKDVNEILKTINANDKIDARHEDRSEEIELL